MGLKTEMTLISFLQANQYEFTSSIEFKSKFSVQWVF